MESDEEYVRAAWKRVQYRETRLTGDGPCYVVISADDHPTAGSTIFMKHGQDKETVFAAARAYTEERKRQIRLIEQEINFLSWRPNFMIADGWESAIKVIVERILAREKATLQSLQRGLRSTQQD